MVTKSGYKDSEIGTVPKDWVLSKFIDIVEKYIDYRGRTPKKLGMEWGNGTILALSANNVQMGCIALEKEAYYGSKALYQKWMKQGDCERGDILLTMEAPLGNVACIPDNKRYILSQRVLLIRPIKNIDKSFLYHVMQSFQFQNQLEKNSTGTTAKGIQRAKLDLLTIAYPNSVLEQRAIATALSDTDAYIAGLEKLIAKKRAIKQGAMEELLTGVFCKYFFLKVASYFSILLHLHFP